ncbi:hypothetical protein CC86DRAFT_402810 [Ophiobolus disseminans]|uniref:Uncharacterized protein n=1 Tax=Ophiobolus disseminans TaxID=1469910 RepID=A0A6A7ADM8_9PLEO|nr:hypothetical protein CC86DRAFT_402810 [Ophiobolus disseminans]
MDIQKESGQMEMSSAGLAVNNKIGNGAHSSPTVADACNTGRVNKNRRDQAKEDAEKLTWAQLKTQHVPNAAETDGLERETNDLREKLRQLQVISALAYAADFVSNRKQGKTAESNSKAGLGLPFDQSHAEPLQDEAQTAERAGMNDVNA